MASVFNKINKFLNRDETRAALAIGGIASGMGAFDNTKYGSTIQNTLGGLNMYTGAKAGGYGGAAQAALGGYGLAQGMGKVGTFGNSYDSLMGNNSGYNNRRAVGGNAIFPGGITDRSAAAAKVNTTRLQSMPKYKYGTNANGNFQVNNQRMFEDDQWRDQVWENPPMDIMAGGENANQRDLQLAIQSQKNAQAMNIIAQDTNNNLIDANYNQVVTPSVGTNGSTNMSSSFRPASVINNNNTVPKSPDQIKYNPLTNTTRSEGYGFSNDGGKGQNWTDFQNMNSGGNDIYPTGNVSAPGFYPNTGEGNNASTTFANLTFEKVFDNIVTKAMKDPLQAVAVGSALVTVFADDPAEEAAKQYAAEMAKVRADTDPNSDFGQDYMSNFTERRTTDLDDAYTKATSDFVSTMAKRGMMDSTIFTEGKASLDARFAELRAKIPMDSQVALQEYQKAQLTNINLGSQAAYRGGALQSAQTNPFSNSFQSAVASTTA